MLTKFSIMEEKKRNKEIYRVTLVGSVVNFILLVFKFVAGIVGHSAAMMADAIHSLSDFITDIIVVVFVKVSSKPEDADHHYGHGKYETLATAIIGLVLLVVGAGIFYNGAEMIFLFFKGGELPEPSLLALIAALVSIVSKELVYQYTIYKGKNLDSQSVVANAWHHRSDALSSIGVALGIGGALVLGDKWRVLDPLAAVIVSIFIVKVSIQLIKPCVDELMEKSLSADVEKEIVDIALSCNGIKAPHHLRTRRIGNHIAIDIHVMMRGDITLTEAHNIVSVLEGKYKERFGNDSYICIHFEPIDSQTE